MPLQIPDASLLPLLLLLLAGVAGLGVGYALSAWVAHLRWAKAAAPKAAVRPAKADNGNTAAEAPRAQPRTHTNPADPAMRQATGLPPAADLLLVDDSAVARVKLRRMVEGAGYRVHLASDGVEALALLDKGHYAMLITDLEMPNMDGVTLINTCLARPQTARMPILAISGHESLRAKFNECRDICGIHRKPWVDDILLSHVATLVGVRPPPQVMPVNRQEAAQRSAHHPV